MYSVWLPRLGNHTTGSSAVQALPPAALAALSDGSNELTVFAPPAEQVELLIGGFQAGDLTAEQARVWTAV